MNEKLSLEKIKPYMTGNYPVHFFESTTSTNTVAKELAASADDSGKDSAAPDAANALPENNTLHGTMVIARHQTGGRGRLGRTFASPDDSGIYMSIILDANNPMLLTTAAAVAVCRAIEKICGQEPQIKWVNDIYLDDKKVCGILAEGITDHETGQLSHVILGIGINCNEAAIPDDLKDIAGAVEGDFSINRLAAEVHNQMMALTDQPDFIDEYRQRSMVIGKTVSVYKGGYTPDKPGVPARVLDIDNAGGLKVIYTDGSRETLSTGEISIRL